MPQSKDIFTRPAVASDIPVWARMRLLLWPEYHLEGHAKDAEELIQNPQFACYLAFAGSEAVGFMDVSLRPYANGCYSRPVAFVEGVWVAENYRQHGIGRLLIQEAEKWARRQGMTELGSDTLLDNTLAHDAHRGWGFEATERILYFRKPL